MQGERKETGEMNISSLYFAVTEWALRQGAENINQQPGCWERDFDFEGRPVVVSINGHDKDQKSRDGMSVPPFNILLAIGGFPAALLDPVSGIIVGGQPGIEDRLIAAFADTSHA